MNAQLWLQLNTVLGSLVVTVGLWLLVGAFPLIVGAGLTLGLAMVLAWTCSSLGYVWAICTFLLGLESLAWPILQMVDIRTLGPEPPLEELQRIFTAVLFGLFSGVFWMTFAYGIFKRTRGGHIRSTRPEPPTSGSSKKKSARKSR